jgi:hypothetical protein
MTPNPQRTEPGPASSPPDPGRALSTIPRHRAIRRANIARAVRLGNSNALRHGVYSDVNVREDVLDEVAILYARGPWLDPTRDGVLVEATARLIVRLRKLDAAIDAEPSQTLTTLSARLEGQLTRNLAELGLTPRAAAALGLAHMDAQARARKLTEDTLARYRGGPSDA